MAVRITRSGVGLTVGIIVLALVVLGGLYIAKERGEQARRQDAIEVAKQNLESQSQGTGTITPSIDGNTETSGDTNKNGATGAGDGSGSSTQGDSQAQPQGQPQGQGQGQGQGSLPTGGQSNGTLSAPTELPQTGPGEFGVYAMLFVLVFAGVSYATSLRVVRSR